MRKIFFFLLLCHGGIYAQDSFIISGTIKNAASDTVRCVLYEDFITRQSVTKYVRLVNGSFRDTIACSKPTHFSFIEGRNYITSIIRPGENIHISYDAKDREASLVFSGTAKEKFEWYNEWNPDNLVQQVMLQVQIARKKKYPFDHLFTYLDSVQTYYLTRLKQIKNLDNETRRMFTAYLEGIMQYRKLSSLTQVYREGIDQTIEKRAQQLTPFSRKTIGRLLKFREDYFDITLYAHSVHNILMMDRDGKVWPVQFDKYNFTFRYLDTILPTKLKVPVMTLFIEDAIINDWDKYEVYKFINFVNAFPGDTTYKDYINRRRAAQYNFKRGMQASDFNLENQRGEKVSLASFKGKVIYMDFWYADCKPCHQQFASVKPVREYYKDNPNVVFLNISVDSKEVWEKAMAKYQIDGYHAYTENKERSHLIIQNYRVNWYPVTFIIDKNGYILVSGPSQNPDVLRNQIEAALKF